MLKSFGLTGRSDNKIDSKGRINIPVQMKKILAPGVSDEVVISLSGEGQLSLFNKAYWVDTIQQNIINQADNSTNESWKAIQRRIHLLSENSHLSTVDSQGRITIPQRLLEKAGLEKDAVIIGAVDRVSVWNPERYEKWISQEQADTALAGIHI